MSANEALSLLADMARGDVAKLMDVGSMGFNLDMAKAKEAGLTKLIKKVKQKTTIYQAKKESEEDREVTELEIELYDAQAAIDKVLKVHGKYVDRVDLTSGGEKITQKDDNARFDRAISTLANALREVVSGKGDKQDGEVDTAK